MSSTASGGDALKVFVRVRPPLPRESADDCVVIADDDAKVVSVVEPAKAKNSSRARAHEAHQFAFDGVRRFPFFHKRDGRGAQGSHSLSLSHTHTRHKAALDGETTAQH